MTIVDRPYQVEAIHGGRGYPGIYKALREHDSTILVMATGCGKTVVFSKVSDACVKRGRRVLIGAHREELLESAKQKLIEVTSLSPEQIGIERAGDRARDHHPVVVASIQTIQGKRLERFRANEFGLFVVDEAHHTISNSYMRVVEHFRGAKLLGVTATPDRLDGKALGKVFASVAYVYEIADAIADRYLVNIRGEVIVGGDAMDLSAVRTTAGDLNQGDLAAILEQDPAVALVARGTVEKAAGRPTLIFAVSVQQARLVADYINAWVGSDVAAALDGTATRDVRRATKGRFEDGSLPYLVNCSLYAEGVDIPSIACVSVGRPTKSRALYCLDSETEILTTSGWLGIDSDWLDAKAAAFDPKDGSIVWSPVSARGERPLNHGEKMFGILNPHLDIRVTECHDVLISRRLRKERRMSAWKKIAARKLKKGEMSIPVSGYQDAPGVPLTDAEIGFVGLRLTDGHRRLDNLISLYQSERYPEVIEYIESVITQCGFKCGHRSHRDPSNFGPRKHALHTWNISKGKPRGRDSHLRGWGDLADYAEDADLSPAWEECTRDQLVVLVAAMNMGNGAKFLCPSIDWEPHTYNIVTSRERLANRLQSLCVRRGMRCNLAREISQVSGSILFRLYINPDKGRWSMKAATCDGRPTWGELPARDGERVWCVSVDTGCIVTRRTGKVAVVGNSQMIGRGTRLLGSTHEESVARGKDSLLVLDFTGVSGRHKLVSVFDVLDGNGNEDVRQRVMRKAERGPIDVYGELEFTAKEIVEEQRRKALEDVKYRTIAMSDPFTVLGVAPRSGRYGGRPPERWQLERLARHKIPGAQAQLDRLNADESLEHEALDFGQAKELLRAIDNRRKGGLCTVKMAGILVKHGLRPDVPFEVAQWAITQIEGNRWKPTAEVLAHPELRMEV